MAAAIAASWGGMIWAPLSQKTLYPLYSGGLWLAVITRAPAASWSRSAKATRGVGATWVKTRAVSPMPAITDAASSASSWLLRRPS